MLEDVITKDAGKKMDDDEEENRSFGKTSAVRFGSFSWIWTMHLSVFEGNEPSSAISEDLSSQQIRNTAMNFRKLFVSKIRKHQIIIQRQFFSSVAWHKKTEDSSSLDARQRLRFSYNRISQAKKKLKYFYFSANQESPQILSFSVISCNNKVHVN